MPYISVSWTQTFNADENLTCITRHVFSAGNVVGLSIFTVVPDKLELLVMYKDTGSPSAGCFPGDEEAAILIFRWSQELSTVIQKFHRPDKTDMWAQIGRVRVHLHAPEELAVVRSMRKGVHLCWKIDPVKLGILFAKPIPRVCSLAAKCHRMNVIASNTGGIFAIWVEEKVEVQHGRRVSAVCFPSKSAGKNFWRGYNEIPVNINLRRGNRYKRAMVYTVILEIFETNKFSYFP